MTSDFYETDKAISEYLLFHYGSSGSFLEQGLGPVDALNFAARCGRIHEGLNIKRERAFDLGCAVGGAAVEMSSKFEQVVGIDYSHGLIEAGNRLVKNGRANIQVLEEGELYREATIQLPREARSEAITLQQGDAMNLDPSIGTFDFVLMANLIDRLPDPRACLKRMGAFVNADGILAITSPYTWMLEYTPRENWLGGFTREGKPVRTIDTLKEILEPHFHLCETVDMPFLIREHSRKNQYSVAQASIWIKKS